MKKTHALIDKVINIFNKNKSSDGEIDDILDNRAKNCLDFLKQNPNLDAHRVDLDTSFLSSYIMFKGSKKMENLTKGLWWFTIVLVFFTIILIGLAFFQIPEYPLYGHSVTPINSQIYIDQGTDIFHDVDYLIKLSKVPLFSSDKITMKMLTPNVNYYSTSDSIGNNFGLKINSSNMTVIYDNINKMNPVLLHITYIEKSFNFNDTPVIIEPMSPNSNSSFFLMIGSGEYDIKFAERDYNLVREANLFFGTDLYDSWINQSVILYENNVPIENIRVKPDGFVTIEVRSLKRGEFKTYFIKKY